jgi:acyl CoA:acetate/3-ketoacid CoA transferase beta subunit
VSDVTRAEVCVVACAEAWRGDGEIVASPIGTVPMIAVRLAASTFEPDLLYTDGDALLLAEPMAVGAAPDAPRKPEAWLPFGKFFDVVWSGKRHVMMGATQIDRYGNQNIACIGPWAKPKAMLLGVRGGPGNTLNHPTSYWIPNHSTRAFVPEVDCVSGVGWDRVPKGSERFHEIRRVVSNLAVLDFETPDHAMRLRSVHPGVTVDEVVAATGFELVVPDDVPETRMPSDDELRLIRDVLDPDGLRNAEVKQP